jgi:hypothetical protein
VTMVVVCAPFLLERNGEFAIVPKRFCDSAISCWIVTINKLSGGCGEKMNRVRAHNNTFDMNTKIVWPL